MDDVMIMTTPKDFKVCILIVYLDGAKLTRLLDNSKKDTVEFLVSVHTNQVDSLFVLTISNRVVGDVKTNSIVPGNVNVL